VSKYSDRCYQAQICQVIKKFLVTLSLTGNSEPEAVFDIYSDVSLTLDVKISSKKTEKIVSTSKNGTVTVQYDENAQK